MGYATDKLRDLQSFLSLLSYTEAQVNTITKGMQVTVCIREFMGEYSDYYDTLQVALEEDGDYIGEFIRDKEINLYYFRFYVEGEEKI